MNKNRNTINHSQIAIDFDAVKWPDQRLFPLNLRLLERTVESIVYKDIEASTAYIIVTGFTSLSNLVDLFGSKDFQNLAKVCILIGFEPNIRGRKKYVKLKLDREIKDYWLKKGVSIMLGGAIINLIDKIDNGQVEFKYKDKLHAKIYVGDHSAVLGSSNFSKNGLNFQEEANIRVSVDQGQVQNEQYNAIKLIAQSYYEEAVPYNEKMRELLMALIKEVTWEEALARALAEILEGSWLEDYRTILAKLEQTKLWPTQWKGITQAVSILQSQSNVLLADPTGAGKTKLCTSLILSLKHWLFEIGKRHKTNSIIICPPLVVSKWADEFRALRQIDNSQISMGLLSNSSDGNKKKIAKDLQLVNILTIDEAHNYLSPTSNRSVSLKSNGADYKILVTATPISKKVEDILKLIELLDIDNLSDDDFERYRVLVNTPYSKSNDEDIQSLRNFISRFTVRRTKRSLNREIDKEPEKYVNKLNKTCRFPKQKEKTYKTRETDGDKKIVRQINELALKLKGVTYLKSFDKPNFEISKQESLEGYIKKRIGAGRALSIYMIRAALRSSHVALVEHIESSQVAMDFFGFCGKDSHTGNKIKTIKGLIELNKLPRRNNIFNKELFPSWLVDKEEYLTACKEELGIYNRISTLAKRLSGQRELGKVEELIKMSKRHTHILAFDGTVITLYYLKKLFEEKYPHQKLLVASGIDKDNESKKVMERFNLASQSNDGCIALCSDKMSESIDLQKASSVVLLDLPSVLRIVEQRIGRVDRMDSLHKEIDIYWPDDSEEYSLKTDSRLIHTNNLVEDIFGSNFEIPITLREKHFSRTDSTSSLIKEYKDFIDKDESWSGIRDSFQSVVELKEGRNPLIPESTYEEFKDVSSEVKTRVSFIGSEKNWCFLALRGDHEKSPRWCFIDEHDNIQTDFSEVCEALRRNVSPQSEKLDWDDNALRRFINLFKQKERNLLPPKKKRALEVAEYILTKKLEKKEQHDSALVQVMKEMLDVMRFNAQCAVDYERLAEEWIEILQPFLENKRSQNKRRKIVLNLYALKPDYKKIDLDVGRLKEIIENLAIVEEIDNKIASCIIGVPNTTRRGSDLSTAE